MDTTQAFPVRLFTEAFALLARYRDVEALQRHVAARRPRLIAASAVLLVVGVACGAGSFVFLAEASSWLALPALMLAPFVALGSIFVEFFVFFSWVEARAIARALGRRLRFGPPPQVPWVAAGLLVFLPLAMLAAAAPGVGLVIVLLGAATPLLYARYDPRG